MLAFFGVSIDHQQKKQQRNGRQSKKKVSLTFPNEEWIYLMKEYLPHSTLKIN